MNKTTDKLLNDIREAKTIGSFFEDNPTEFDSLLFVKTLKSHLEAKRISKQKLVREAHLNQSYVYDILNAKKTPSRDTVVKLSFALGLTLTETSRLLKLAGYSELYPRIEREAIIIFCIENQKCMCYTNDLLYSMQENLLFESKCLGM
ncbi:MAG: helix-turn-helix domain-containing protein [Defluviitaleaceae bacterium]|nr:helix-turn-helix domain-containing protein [Defluviitaleaceae bacterium]